MFALLDADERHDELVAADARQDVFLAQRQAESLSDLVSDTLDLAKIEAGRFTLDPRSFSLHELLISLFLFISAPVSAYMLAKAAVLQQLPLDPKTRGKPWEQ